MDSLTGKWIFTEEFECGTDRGFAYLKQNGNELIGYLEYEECIEDEEPFLVRQIVEGTIKGHKIVLRGREVMHPDGTPIPNYNLDVLEGTYTHEEKIVGHSYDSEDVCGVFVMKRVNDNETEVLICLANLFFAFFIFYPLTLNLNPLILNFEF